MKVAFKNLVKLKDTKTLSHPEFSVLIKQQPAWLLEQVGNVPETLLFLPNLCCFTDVCELTAVPRLAHGLAYFAEL